MNAVINAVIHGNSERVKMNIKGGEDPREFFFQAGQTFNVELKDGETLEIVAHKEEVKDETIDTTRMQRGETL